MLSRVVHGARTSLLIGLGATAIALGAGALVGVLAGFGHRVADGALMRGIDVLAAIPELLLALVAIVVLGTGATNVAVAVGIANIPSFARLVRSQVLVVRRTEYVDAARTLGRRPAWIAARHVLPNSLGPVLALAAITAGTAVLAGAGLSYLGFGPGPPSPEWGSMLVDGQRFLREAPWVVAFPGLAIVTVVVAAGVLGARVAESGAMSDNSAGRRRPACRVRRDTRSSTASTFSRSRRVPGRRRRVGLGQERDRAGAARPGRADRAT